MPRPIPAHFATQAIIAASLLLIACRAYSHVRGQDANGGHLDTSTGEYHCHANDCVHPDDVGEEVDDPPDGEDDEPITVAGSWSTAKAWASDTAHVGISTTLYCGCDYTATGRSGGSIDHDSCDYDDGAQSHSGRADRLEWEHVVPASLMPARQFACWNDGLPNCDEPGRECCERLDLNARVIIFDLHNLVPSDGQVNALRSNKRYGLIDDEEHLLGSCDFEWSDDLAEPAESVRGEVARTWLYFVDEHNLQLHDGELEMYMQWSNDDPPTEDEFAKNDRIREKQGDGNPFIEMFPQP